MSPRVASALSVAAVLLVSACGTGHGNYNDAMANWRAGQHSSALARAQDEYARFRDGNGLAEAEIRRTADAVRQRLAETPVVARRGPAPITPGGGPRTLANEMRADLLSGEITPTVRTAAVVAGLGLKRHAYELITIVYRREPFAPDGGLLEDATVAMRALVAKRVALDALESLTATRP